MFSLVPRRKVEATPLLPPPSPTHTPHHIILPPLSPAPHRSTPSPTPPHIHTQHHRHHPLEGGESDYYASFCAMNGFRRDGPGREVAPHFTRCRADSRCACAADGGPTCGILEEARHCDPRAGYRSALDLSRQNPAALCGRASSAEGRTVGGSADCRVSFLSAAVCRQSVPVPRTRDDHGGLQDFSCSWYGSSIHSFVKSCLKGFSHFFPVRKSAEVARSSSARVHAHSSSPTLAANVEPRDSAETNTGNSSATVFTCKGAAGRHSQLGSTGKRGTRFKLSVARGSRIPSVTKNILRFC